MNRYIKFAAAGATSLAIATATACSNDTQEPVAEREVSTTERARDQARDYADRSREALNDAGRYTKERSAEVRERAGEAAERTGDAVGEAYEDIKQDTEGLRERAADAGERAAERTRDATERASEEGREIVDRLRD